MTDFYNANEKDSNNESAYSQFTNPPTGGLYDPAIGSITAPVGNSCTDSFQTLSAFVFNYGTAPINTTSNPITVTFNVVGPTGSNSYTHTIGGVAGSPVLQPLASNSLSFSATSVNMFAGGIYKINALVSCPSLSNESLSNDSLPNAIILTNQRPVAGPDYKVCQNSPIPFGQGLSVAGCSTPIFDSVTITFTISNSFIDNVGSTANGDSYGPPSNCSDQYAALFASGIIPALPPGASIYSDGVLTITNMKTNVANSWANEVRMNLYYQTPTGANLLSPGLLGNTLNAGSTNFTYQRAIPMNQISSILSTVPSGGNLRIGYWESWNDNFATNDASKNAGSTSIATLKIYYSYLPASYSWYDVPTLGTSLYNITPFNPLIHPNAIVNNSLTPGVYKFYAACSSLPTCRVPVNLVINPNPVSFTVSSQTCEYAVGAALSIFNLTNLDSSVAGGSSSNTVVMYFSDPNLLNPISNSNAFLSGSGIIYSKVNYTATGCSSSSSVLLTSVPTPEFNLPIYMGFVCAPNTIDIDSIINIYSVWPTDTLFFSSPAFINTFPNPHSIGNPDTVYMIVKANNVAFCADTAMAIIDIIASPNTIANQSNSNSSICGSVPCGLLTMSEGDTTTLYVATDCSKVASIKDSIDGVNLGMISICEEIACSPYSWPLTNGQLYVNRQYKISSTNQGKAIVSLYYLQKDFEQYNAAALLHTPQYQPIDPCSNLTLVQVVNGSIDSPLSSKIIIPNSLISASYDSSSTIWTIRFPVDSFGTFYAYSANLVNTTVHIKCFIEAYMNGSNSMQPVLFNQQRPTTPFACDTIQVELHQTKPPYCVIASAKTLLSQNGNVNCLLKIPDTTADYYLVLTHRNAIETWSSNPITITGGITPPLYDFTNSSSKSYGNNMKLIGANSWAFFSGDINHDQNIDLVDIAVLENDIGDFLFGYYNTDLNGDGNIDLLDLVTIETNINNFIFSNHP